MASLSQQIGNSQRYGGCDAAMTLSRSVVLAMMEGGLQGIEGGPRIGRGFNENHGSLPRRPHGPPRSAEL